MIGSGAKSSGFNWNPIDKKNLHLDTKSNQVSVTPLKLRIMLQIYQDNYDAGIKDDTLKRSFGLEWNVDDMVQHQEKMLEIIKIVMDEQVFVIHGGTHTGFSIYNVGKLT